MRSAEQFRDLAADFREVCKSPDSDDVASRYLLAVSAHAARLLQICEQSGEFRWPDNVSFAWLPEQTPIRTDERDATQWMGAAQAICAATPELCVSDPNVLRRTAPGEGYGTHRDWRARARHYAYVCEYIARTIGNHVAGHPTSDGPTETGIILDGKFYGLTSTCAENRPTMLEQSVTDRGSKRRSRHTHDRQPGKRPSERLQQGSSRKRLDDVPGRVKIPNSQNRGRIGAGFAP